MKLRNMNKYMKAIENYCKATNIKLVEHPNLDGCGEYNPNSRTIKYDPCLSDSDVISTLLHELGHYQDDFRNPNKYAGTHHIYGRTRIERDYVYLTVNQKKAIWDTETEAWNNGRAIAKQLKIPLGKWFDKDETSALNTYRSIRIL